MAEVGSTFNQYTTVKDLFRGLPQWVSDLDQQRIASYSVYEQIYWNVPEAFKLVQRGDDSQPIYIPSGKQIVETLHRFLANDMEVVVDEDFGQEAARAEAKQIIVDLFRRERLTSKFTANKRFGIIRGDWMWHVYADPERSEGNRISIMPVDPASYFPIYKDENLDEQVGAHIVEPFTDDDGKERIRRLTYRKLDENGEPTAGPANIWMDDRIFEIDKWGQPGTEMGEKTVKVIAEEVMLPPPIRQLPIYHIQNFQEPQNPWGSSELRGMERVIAAVNQAISDEELTLALEGLGVYTTTAGQPVDENGDPVAWTIGPGKVIETDAEDEFKRVQGVSSLAPFQDHLAYLHEQLDLGTGTPAIAKGDVDVTTAESGVALAIKMGPLLARAGEKENIITDNLGNMFFDLRHWIQAYEPQWRDLMENIRWMPVYGDKIPQNRKGRFDELMTLSQADPPIVSRAYIRRELEKIGYEFPDDTEMMAEILDEKTIFGKIDADVEGARIDREMEAVLDPTQNGGPVDEDVDVNA